MARIEEKVKDEPIYHTVFADGDTMDIKGQFLRQLGPPGAYQYSIPPPARRPFQILGYNFSEVHSGSHSYLSSANTSISCSAYAHYQDIRREAQGLSLDMSRSPTWALVDSTETSNPQI